MLISMIVTVAITDRKLHTQKFESYILKSSTIKSSTNKNYSSLYEDIPSNLPLRLLKIPSQGFRDTYPLSALTTPRLYR